VRVTFETTPGAAQDDDVPSDGLDEVQTELVSMSLTGDTVNYGVVPVTLWSGAPSLGEIEEQVDGTIADLDLFNQNLAGPQTFVAGNTITAGGDFSFFPDLVVLDDAQIVLHAGNVVVMKHGVQVDQNGNLTVIVDSVSNGVLDLPPFGTGDADSFFDLYIETTINFLGVWVLHNELPARIETVITEWPPRTNEVYVGTFDPPLPLLQPNGEQFGLSALVRVELELRPTGD
jgi:hypothetical protein